MTKPRNAAPIKPPRLRAGDRIRLVSPASTPDDESLGHTASVLEAAGFVVEMGDHVRDRYGYMAGRDEDRLSDINDALRDPGVRAVVAARGGKGAYRIADGLDFEAAMANRPLLVGFSDITILHLALLKNAGLSGVHGGLRPPHHSAPDGVIEAMTSTDEVVLTSDNRIPTAVLTSKGYARGRLVGGNQDMIASAAGWVLPSLDDTILLLEAVDMRLGHIDRQLNMLEKTDTIERIAGIAVGSYFLCGPDNSTQGDWSAVDVLQERLSKYGVPVLGGLPIGHGPDTVAVPIGTTATIETSSGTLAVEAAVE